jgi:futalosine hydrolase
MKKILIVAATTFEIQPFIDFLKKQIAIKKNPLFGANGYEIDVLITGVGMVNTAYLLGKRLTEKTYDGVINAGVAGSFTDKILRGGVVEVVSETYGDLGVEEASGAFTTVHELGLIGASELPFQKGKLVNKTPLNIKNLPQANGLTVQKVHGTAKSITQCKKNFPDVHIETMEGAAVFQVCLTEGIPFAQLRSISNFVEPRNRDNWAMKEAIENLNSVLMELIQKKMI